jgi:hypothetical protein
VWARRILVCELVVWLTLIYPTVTMWHNSVPYLVFISLYAVIRTSVADIRIHHDERTKEGRLREQDERLERIEKAVLHLVRSRDGNSANT